MPSIDEAAESGSQLFAALRQGVETLSLRQEIVFTKYVRVVLPLDGFVFWVRSDLVSVGALFNAMRLNALAFNWPNSVAGNQLLGGIGSFSIGYTPIGGYAVPANPGAIYGAPTIFAAQGSLHYASTQTQDETTGYVTNKVVFTSETEINPFNIVGPNVMYLGTFQGIRFAFSQRRSFYQQAGLHHYVGDAVYAEMESQIIDDRSHFDGRAPVVSNSLPIWLSMNNYVPPPYEVYGNQSAPMYPSFLVPSNLPPPYMSVHILPETTRALSSSPTFDKTMTHTQLTTERVRITIYGLRNDAALDFVDFVSQFSLNNPDILGIMNMPTIRDEKKTQSELGVIAQKKAIDFDVNYYQTRVNDIARQLILEAIPTFIFA